LKLVLDASAIAKWFIVEEESGETGKQEITSAVEGIPNFYF